MNSTKIELLHIVLILLSIAIQPTCGLIKQPDEFRPFNGIPAAFGDLSADKRTDIVVISGDGHILSIYFQQRKQPVFDKGFSCKCDRRIAQVYLADLENDGFANVLPLLVSQHNNQVHYELVNLKTETMPMPGTMAALESGDVLLTGAALAAGTNNASTNTTSGASAEALKRAPVPEEPPLEECKYETINVRMKKQPLLFDLEGDLQTDFMSVDVDNRVSVWKPPKEPGVKDFEKTLWPVPIESQFFEGPHSHSFIDINHDQAADVVLSSQEHIMYMYAAPNINETFVKDVKNLTANMIEYEKYYEFGQSSLVDINADGIIDHVIPRCRKPPAKRTCDIVVLHGNGFVETIYKFENNSSEYTLETVNMGPHYQFPITLRSGDLDGDGYTDFVTIVREAQNDTNRIAWLRNVADERSPGAINNGRHHKQQSSGNNKNDNSQQEQHQQQNQKQADSNYVAPAQSSESIVSSRSIARTFQMHEVPFKGLTPREHVKLVVLFDINEDGKVDMLIGSSENDVEPKDMRITARMNSQMVDACFMKVLVTNGYCGQDSCSTTVTNGQSARGPFICFELSQNDGKVRKGCAGQLAQSSHFALQAPYVIFGLGQTPHFVETLTVSIPGYGRDGHIRTRVFEQIVPDAQVIIIPNPKEYPNNWDYKLFLSPMSDLVLSTLITLAVICLLILLIICILHRKESLEDLAEHEEYKRHWPESR